jgi:hypothetical protein
METKYKVPLALFCIIVIVVFIIIIIVYRNTLFTNRIEYTYPNGCKEVYVNTKLISPPCNYNEADDFAKRNILDLNITPWIQNGTS